MRRLFASALAFAAFAVLADERPVEIDQNTKIQGGADVRGSGANAGAGARSDNQVERQPRVSDDQRRDVAQPDRVERGEDKPIGERKPRAPEPEPQTGATGETAPPPR